MKMVYEFYCDSGKPTEQELIEAIKLANDDNCYVKLNYLLNEYTGCRTIVIGSGMTLDYCKSCIPSVFPV